MFKHKLLFLIFFTFPFFCSLKGNNMSKNECNLGYSKDFVELIEMVYGEGFLSQGGPEAIDYMVKGTDLNGKKVLDIGSGLGKIEFYLAKKFDLEIIGVEVEPYVFEESKKRLYKIENELKGKVDFVIEGCSDYLKQFEDGTFDIILSKETTLHIPIEDKVKYFEQVYRILKPSGKIIIMDWFHTSPDYSKELKEMIEADGILYNLTTKQEYLDVLNKAGFKNISFTDTTTKTIQYNKEDCEKIVNLKSEIEKRFGKDAYKDSLSSWTIQKNAFENGELITGILKAEK